MLALEMAPDSRTGWWRLAPRPPRRRFASGAHGASQVVCQGVPSTLDLTRTLEVPREVPIADLSPDDVFALKMVRDARGQPPAKLLPILLHPLVIVCPRCGVPSVLRPRDLFR